MTCEHRTDDWRCGIDAVKGFVTLVDCARCMSYSGPSRGLGDDLSKLIEASGLARVAKPRCRGCGKRRAALNRIAPKGN